MSGPGSSFILSVQVIQSKSDPMLSDPFQFGFSKFFWCEYPHAVQVVFFSSPRMSGPGFPGMLFAYNYPVSSYLSLGSMLDRLDLKKYADCISQRLKRTSGGRVMTFFCLTLI